MNSSTGNSVNVIDPVSFHSNRVPHRHQPDRDCLQLSDQHAGQHQYRQPYGDGSRFPGPENPSGPDVAADALRRIPILRSVWLFRERCSMPWIFTRLRMSPSSRTRRTGASCLCPCRARNGRGQLGGASGASQRVPEKSWHCRGLHRYRRKAIPIDAREFGPL